MLSRIPLRVSLWIPSKDFPKFLSLFYLPLPQEIFPCRSFSYKYSTNFLREISPKISPVLPSINCRELSFLTRFLSEFLPEPLSVDKFRLVLECLSGCFWIYPGHSPKIYSGVLLRVSAEAIAHISNGVLPVISFRAFSIFFFIVVFLDFLHWSSWNYFLRNFSGLFPEFFPGSLPKLSRDSGCSFWDFSWSFFFGMSPGIT